MAKTVRKYRRRYFKSTKSVKAFIATLLDDYLNNKISEQTYRGALAATTQLLKACQQLYYEEKLGDLPQIIEELKTEI